MNVKIFIDFLLLNVVVDIKMLSASRMYCIKILYRYNALYILIVTTIVNINDIA